MATIANTMTLDGSTSFTSFGRTWAWDTSDPSEGWISTIRIDGRSGADAYVANATFSGDWGTRYLRFDPDNSAPMQANITDLSDGGTRLIRLFEIYENRGGPVFSTSFMPRSALALVRYYAASFIFGLRLS